MLPSQACRGGDSPHQEQSKQLFLALSTFAVAKSFPSDVNTKQISITYPHYRHQQHQDGGPSQQRRRCAGPNCEPHAEGPPRLRTILRLRTELWTLPTNLPTLSDRPLPRTLPLALPLDSQRQPPDRHGPHRNGLHRRLQQQTLPHPLRPTPRILPRSPRARRRHGQNMRNRSQPLGHHHQ